ncbi:MAG: hypothetical protein IIY77_06400 [Lachnospiraceae bacterium]|nr:hypothetical protein [Lachnospiraceae bacterium]
MKKINREYGFYETVFVIGYLTVLFAGLFLMGIGFSRNSRDLVITGAAGVLPAAVTLKKPGRFSLAFWCLTTVGEILYLMLTGTDLFAVFESYRGFFEGLAVLYLLLFPLSILIYEDLLEEKERKIRRFFQRKMKKGNRRPGTLSGDMVCMKKAA